MNHAEALHRILAANPKAFPRLLTQRLLRNAAGLSKFECEKIEAALKAKMPPDEAGENAVVSQNLASTPAPATITPKAPADTPQEPPQSTAPTPPAPLIDPLGKVKASPAALALHKKHSHHHALMVAAHNDAERAEHAREIMENILPKLDAEYDRLRAAAAAPEREDGADGVEFEQGPILNASDADGVQQMRRLQSLRTRIARLKNKLIPNAPDPKRRAELEKQLALAVAEREQIERSLA